MKDSIQDPLPPFNVIDFEVHAVYGAHFNTPTDNEDKQQNWIDWFNGFKQKSCPIREGWTPIYRDHCSTITIDIGKENDCKEIEVAHPKFFEQGKENYLANNSKITLKVSRQLTIRKDGEATITIRLKAVKREKLYDLADILTPLLLAPRIMEGIKLDSDNAMNGKKKEVNYYNDQLATTDTKIYLETNEDHKNLSTERLDRLATDDKSPMFKLLLGALKDAVTEVPGLSWEENQLPKQQPKKNTNISSELTSDILHWVGDQQIPSFVVFATLPRKLYENAFLEIGAEFQEVKMKMRQQYTRELAAILLRWLTPHNASFISIDFLESLGLLRNGAFVNKYMNSLSFVTYASTGTICLKPEQSDNRQLNKLELNPQEATYGSILRCVELSRLRWHHAIRLNRRLDELTEDVINYQGVSRFEDFLSKLLTIRAEAALHFLDPLTYQWDATVGADIANFLQVDIIDKIENECMQKLETVKELIHEKLDVLRAKTMRGAL